MLKSQSKWRGPLKNTIVGKHSKRSLVLATWQQNRNKKSAFRLLIYELLKLDLEKSKNLSNKFRQDNFFNVQSTFQPV